MKSVQLGIYQEFDKLNGLNVKFDRVFFVQLGEFQKTFGRREINLEGRSSV